MLYYLFRYLEQYDFPGARMFGYVSFRSLMAVILSLLISAIFGEFHQTVEAEADYGNTAGCFYRSV